MLHILIGLNIALLIIIMPLQKATADDNTCGVNYFNGWCKDVKEDSLVDNNKAASDPYVWQPKFANEPPQPLVDVFRNPLPENVARYRDWYKKRMDRVQEVGRILSAPETQPQSSRSQLKTTNETKQVVFNKAVYFFSEGCPVCARMTPLLSDYQSSGKLVGIGIKSTDRGATAYLEHSGVRIPAVGDYSGEMAKNYNVTAVPTLILLSDNGEVVGHHEGAMDRASLSKVFNVPQ